MDVADTLYDQLQRLCPGARFRLPCFELNANEHDLHRALSNAYAINRGERLGYIFPIITSANALQVDGQNDNGWDQGLLFMDSSKAWLQPPGYVTQMAAAAHLPVLSDWTAEGDAEELDITAAASGDGRSAAVKLVNLAGNSRQITLTLEGQTVDRQVTVTVLTAGLLEANTAREPDRVKPASRTEVLPAQGLTLEIPAYSYVTVVTA